MSFGFDLKSPCKRCPFRKNMHYLRRDRAESIAKAITDGDKPFTCHKMDRGKNVKDGLPQQCAGAMILLEKLDRPNQMMRVGAAFGVYQRDKMNMSAPVCDTVDEFIENHKY